MKILTNKRYHKLLCQQHIVQFIRSTIGTIDALKCVSKYIDDYLNNVYLPRPFHYVFDEALNVCTEEKHKELVDELHKCKQENQKLRYENQTLREAIKIVSPQAKWPDCPNCKSKSVRIRQGAPLCCDDCGTPMGGV